ncbi:lymphocyte antigen 75-like [Mizuhopecten yessoensis]|uniref:lymphocyte antigen 75-like n=1 Tax=Mizuhopecten yessoensis TaxID=6573 RepID=UPI000B45F69E|nr:lymphocyte antigen 75-like [Mizuhopecten yessoensis]
MKSSRSRLCWLAGLVLIIVLKQSEVTDGSQSDHMCVKYDNHSRTMMRLYEFQSMTGTIITRLPGFDFYGKNLRCEWYIDAGAYGRVKMTFIDVDLQPNWYLKGKCSEHDHLTLQNSLGRYERHICPEYHAEQFISFGRGTYVTFQSDSEENEIRRKGIEIRYEMFDPATLKCPPGWTCGPENREGACRCYHVMKAPSSKVDFESAQKFCGFSNANLVKIESREVHNFIERLVFQSNGVTEFWIGLNDIEQEGLFEWIDRSPLSYDQRRKENSATDNCVIQEVATGSWVTVPCEERHFYVCEMFSIYDTSVYLVPERALTPEQVDEFMNVMKVLACVGGAILMVIICCCYCCCCRKSSTNKNNQPTGQTQNTAGEQAIPLANSPPPAVEPTAPPLSEFQPMAAQGYHGKSDGLPSYEECMGLPAAAQ